MTVQDANSQSSEAGQAQKARNFSNPAEDAPVSCETLQENGVLDERGSPTKKWRAEERERRLEEKKQREIVARWVSDGSMEGGRARRVG